ncbi:hypothetical protein CGZ93_02155 [Enemella dayhoffiae]|uniref:Uncharacterized protein n=1 Tax=Enemella dayhoffiae TaxID=2016507 RepID=A0A255HBA6_9ACTN|nr:hypothetical protein [Enemella dayhoffiae]OYO25268.1 hypothetical protein CGZ93_02155 [Enemella dayhoffiae]
MADDRTPTGSTPWSPGQNPRALQDTPERTPETAELPGLAGEDEPQARSNVPVKVMIIALVALLATLGVVGYLVTRGTAPTPPAATPLAPEPTGVPELPVTAGSYSRDPGNVQAPPEFGVDRSIQTTSANYRQNGQPALIAVAARPVNDGRTLLTQIKTNAIRQVGDAWCGRMASNDLDVCVLRRGTTALLVVGLRSQPVNELVAAGRDLLRDTK